MKEYFPEADEWFMELVIWAKRRVMPETKLSDGKGLLLIVCTKCGAKRWVSTDRVMRRNFTGLCRRCCTSRVRRNTCQKCGAEYRQTNPHEVLCRRCLKTLPCCGSCGTVMAPEYGFMEGFARKVGKYDICGSCYREMKQKGFLHVTETQYLMPNGRVKIKSSKAGENA